MQSRELSSLDDLQFGQNSIELQVIAAENGDAQYIEGVMRPVSYSIAELDSVMRDCSDDHPFCTSLSYSDDKDCETMWNILVNKEIQRIEAADAEKRRKAEEEHQRKIAFQKVEEEKRRQEEQVRLKAEREAEERRKQEEQARLKAEHEAEEKRRQKILQRQKEEKERIRKEQEEKRVQQEYTSQKDALDMECKRWQTYINYASIYYFLVLSPIFIFQYKLPLLVNGLLGITVLSMPLLFAYFWWKRYLVKKRIDELSEIYPTCVIKKKYNNTEERRKYWETLKPSVRSKILSLDKKSDKIVPIMSWWGLFALFMVIFEFANAWMWVYWMFTGNTPTVDPSGASWLFGILCFTYYGFWAVYRINSIIEKKIEELENL